MSVMFLYFTVISVILLPIAYLKSLWGKITKIKKAKTIYDQFILFIVAVMFLITGPPTVLLTFVTDCYYFWKNNFKPESDLKKIVIPREKNTITNESIKKMKFLCEKFIGSRIKAVYGVDYVKKFREDLDINSLLQFLIFGQFIKKNEKTTGNEI